MAICQLYNVYTELSPHTVGEAFYNGEVESELRRIEKVDYRFYKYSDREQCMEMIEEIRRQSIYPHNKESCTDECKKRGDDCAKLLIVGCLLYTCSIMIMVHVCV